MQPNTAGMEDLDEVRKRKLQELQQRIDAQQNQEAAFDAKLGQIESEVKKRLTKEALYRYSTIKTAHPELAVQVLSILVQLMQREKIIDDQKLRRILELIQLQKKEMRIKTLKK
jgi:programmed cell death protein 5